MPPRLRVNRRHGPSITTTAVIPALFLLSAGCSPAPANPPVDVGAIKQLLAARGDSLVAAESAKDSARAVAFYAEDVVVEPANMPAVKGRTEMGKLYGMFFPMVADMGSTRTALEVAASGDLAWEYGINRVTMAGSKTPTLGKYLAVWKKVDDQWLVAAIAFSDDVPPPPAPPAKK